jgi:hypothetical protein
VKNDNLPSGSRWFRHSILLSLAVAAIVSVLGILFDHILVLEGLPRLAMMIMSNVLTGVFAGGLFLQLAREEKANRVLVQSRMNTIAELNHHIRNALQVIKFLGGQQRTGLDAVQLQLINDSVNRIEWALREVLPRYPLDALDAGRAESHATPIGPAA